MSNWQDMLDKKAGSASPQPDAAFIGPNDDEANFAPLPDPMEYKPWLLQRGGRPAMFLDLRRFEPRTGTLIGCQMSYPHLISIDYIGDRMISLDFGTRTFIIEGTGLCQLSSRLQQGSVLALQEYCASVWASQPKGPVITKLVSMVREN